MINIKYSLKESECACTRTYISAENNNRMLEKEKAFIGSTAYTNCHFPQTCKTLLFKQNWGLYQNKSEFKLQEPARSGLHVNENLRNGKISHHHSLGWSLFLLFYSVFKWILQYTWKQDFLSVSFNINHISSFVHIQQYLPWESKAMHIYRETLQSGNSFEDHSSKITGEDQDDLDRVITLRCRFSWLEIPIQKQSCVLTHSLALWSSVGSTHIL